VSAPGARGVSPSPSGRKGKESATLASVFGVAVYIYFWHMKVVGELLLSVCVNTAVDGKEKNRSFLEVVHVDAVSVFLDRL
jgi:hypothetical protein